MAMMRPNKRIVAALSKHHPTVAPSIISHVASIPEMTLERAERFLFPHDYDALCADILPPYTGPAGLKDLEAAAEHLAYAIRNGESIGISGDYDVDGNCSTALMVRFLHASGVEPSRIHVHIPNRKREGYGVNRDAVAAMADASPPVTTLITLDNGTLAHAPIEAAHQRGISTIIIDHHPNSKGQSLPKGALVVNPKRYDEPFKNNAHGVGDLAAVGVTWLVCKRAAEILARKNDVSVADYYTQHHLPTPDPRQWLGLVALATQADVVNVQGPLNRALLKEGLTVIRRGEDPWIANLIQASGFDKPLSAFTETDISFKLGPIINAPGRLGQSVAWAFLSPSGATTLPSSPPTDPLDSLIQSAVEENKSLYHAISAEQARITTLSADQAQTGKKRVERNPQHDRKMAEILKRPEVPIIPDHRHDIDPRHYALMLLSNEANERRKLVEAAVMRQARPQAVQWLKDNPESHTLTLWSDHWHEGVIGIVAGRIKEEFGLPTIVASVDPETGIAKASARSIKVAGYPVDIGEAFRSMCAPDHVLKVHERELAKHADNPKECERLQSVFDQQFLMRKAGGHPMAAGASFAASNLPRIRAHLEQTLAPACAAARKHQHGTLAGVLDFSSSPRAGTTPMDRLQHYASEQDSARPFGEGAPKPRIGLCGLTIDNFQRMGNGRHLTFTLRHATLFGTSTMLRACAFHAAGSALEQILLDAAAAAHWSKDHTPLILLTGTIEHSAPEHADSPAVIFYLEDILAIPKSATPTRESNTWQLAKALGCSPYELSGVFNDTAHKKASHR